MKINKFLAVATGIFSLWSCSIDAAQEVAVQDAVTIIKPTKGNNVQGLVTFSPVEGGIKIVADIANLKPGKHGFHIHEFGDCSAEDGSSAGGHFNPTKMKHGGPNSEERHAGDLGNLEADERGYAHYERIDKVLKLTGPESIVGKSVIIHADPDDFFTQPTGNSGGRLGCGVIKLKIND